MSEQDDSLTTIYKAMGQLEAEIIKGHLEVENIPCILKYESLGIVYGLTVNGLGCVKIQVPQRYAEEAKKIISASDTGDQTGMDEPATD